MNDDVAAQSSSNKDLGDSNCGHDNYRLRRRPQLNGGVSTNGAVAVTWAWKCETLGCGHVKGTPLSTHDFGDEQSLADEAEAFLGTTVGKVTTRQVYPTARESRQLPERGRRARRRRLSIQSVNMERLGIRGSTQSVLTRYPRRSGLQRLRTLWLRVTVGDRRLWGLK
jgi:hypothetical protein